MLDSNLIIETSQFDQCVDPIVLSGCGRHQYQNLFWYRYQIKTSYFCQKRINLHFRVSLPSHRGANASSKHFSVDQSKVFYQKIGTGTKKLVLVPPYTRLINEYRWQRKNNGRTEMPTKTEILADIKAKKGAVAAIQPVPLGESNDSWDEYQLAKVAISEARRFSNQRSCF
jgi:hypothetical protein